MNKRYVYGTQDKKWHLVGPGDRDYVHGIESEEFDKMTEAERIAKYLAPVWYK